MIFLETFASLHAAAGADTLGFCNENFAAKERMAIPTMRCMQPLPEAQGCLGLLQESAYTLGLELPVTTGGSGHKPLSEACWKDPVSYLQVRGFWAQLEAATNERQQAMFRMLNAHLNRLAQRVETVVGDLLEVHTLPPMHWSLSSHIRCCMTDDCHCLWNQ